MIRKFAIITSTLFVLLSTFSLAAAYQPWSEAVFEHVKKEYGAPAEKRMRYLHNMILENQDLSEMEKVKLVNNTLNHIPWIADAIHWKKANYWASPMETIATFGGDCEDIAIIKWVMLTHLGISNEKLRLAHVRIKKTGEDHMVLVYFEAPSAEFGQQKGWVLDNYTDEVKRGTERTDLLAVYLTDANGNIALIADNGKERSVKGIYKNKKMRKLEDLKAKIQKDREIYRTLNGGRPMFPQAK
jgi:predicted transglutaminase-like cysteine proteinase